MTNQTLKRKVGKKLKEACNVFSNAEVLKTVYLNKDWTEVLKKHEEKFKEEKEEKKSLVKNLSFSSSVLSNEISSGKIGKLKDEIDNLTDVELTKSFPHLE